jgi:hypothetical protein
LEYWKLKQLNSPIQFDVEFKDDIWPIVNLHRSMKAANIGIPYVLKLLRVANEDLPALEKKCEDLRTEINSLEEQVQNSRAILGELNNQITGAIIYRIFLLCMSTTVRPLCSRMMGYYLLAHY